MAICASLVSTSTLLVIVAGIGSKTSLLLVRKLDAGASYNRVQGPKGFLGGGDGDYGGLPE